MIRIRRSEERGHADHGWLDARHTFSFAGHLDPAHMGFRSLRVLNEDRVQPGRGFPEHGHGNMEIVTYVLEGALAHKDSIGRAGTLRPGEFQYMSAGTGIRHSEFNPSQDEIVHLLQIWVLPAERDTEPRYEQRAFPVEPDVLQRIDLPIGQDVRLYRATLRGEAALRHELDQGRGAWLQVTRGELALNGTELRAGDGAAVEEEPVLEVTGGPAEALLFDLA